MHELEVAIAGARYSVGKIEKGSEYKAASQRDWSQHITSRHVVVGGGSLLFHALHIRFAIDVAKGDIDPHQHPQVSFPPRNLLAFSPAIPVMLEYRPARRLDLVDEACRVRCVMFSPDGNFLAAGIDDEVVVWSTTSWSIQFVQQSPSRVLSLAWEGLDQLYFGSENGVLTTVIVSEKPIEYIAVHRQTGYMALGGEDEIILSDFGISTRFLRALNMKRILPRTWKIMSELCQDVHHLSMPVSEKGIRIYSVDNGRNTSCLENEFSIPKNLPVMWLHGGSFVLCALEGRAALWHIAEQCYTMIDVENGKFKNASITHLAYRKREVDDRSQRLVAMVSEFNSIGPALRDASFSVSPYLLIVILSGLTLAFGVTCYRLELLIFD
ncbi:hypothetical protein AGABI2DRAFT_140268 [Agaricus bisporus var. bisporus H97]|uniref:hypothetical protein n=1 Tax=Agaricus bisporus var. bisporus (strain H97 / ATCC MYA-4626 / FGSC 10389) TaxID=936046 RepID=UPI00029F5D1A|nr:hypothetical protein AGABI2DRAFT_140268 [Agaricus bisporus var. bisporus H97]EKV51222.1 hypothetical protein AGABI2DRAFT_140268 [Agaricus bisporus var. bisporus H97]